MPEQTNTYDSAYPSVTDVFSRHHDNLALIYGHSDRRRYNALAFQVTRSVRRIERVHDAFTIADGSTKEFGWFGDNGFSVDASSPGTEVFSIQSERSHTLQEWGFAIPQDGVYVGLQTADGDTLDGLREGDSRGRGLSAEDLDTRGGVLSDYTYVDSPQPSTDDLHPTTAMAETAEQGLFRIDSEQDGPNRFYFAFNNQSGGQVNIDVIGRAQTYDVRPVTDEQTARDIIAGDSYSRRTVQYGPMSNTNPNLPREWYDYRVTVRADELMP